MARVQTTPIQTAPASMAEGPREAALRTIFRLYKATLSPILHAIAPSRCLYLPTCSEYAYTAISRFGIVRGSWMALRRFARCHPWGKGGLDPVPEPAGPRREQTNQNRADHLP